MSSSIADVAEKLGAGKCLTEVDVDAIITAVRLCLFDDPFRVRCQSCDNPYGIGKASQEIARVLAETPLDKRLIQKIMTLEGEVRDGYYY